jgi:chromosome segregation ATPase
LINTLEDEVQELEDYKTELNQYLFDALAEEQEVEASINALQSELTYLRTKVVEGYNQIKEQNWELYLLQNEKQQQDAEANALQNQITTLENKIKELIKDINQIELAKKTEVSKIESEIDCLKLELNQLQFQVTEKQNYQKTIEQDLLNQSQQKYQLIEEKQTLQANLNFLRVELNQLQAQVLEQQNEKKALEQGLVHFEEQRRQLLEGLHNLKVQVPASPPPLPPSQITELPNEC